MGHGAVDGERAGLLEDSRCVAELGLELEGGGVHEVYLLRAVLERYCQVACVPLRYTACSTRVPSSDQVSTVPSAKGAGGQGSVRPQQ